MGGSLHDPNQCLLSLCSRRLVVATVVDCASFSSLSWSIRAFSLVRSARCSLVKGARHDATSLSRASILETALSYASGEKAISDMVRCQKMTKKGALTNVNWLQGGFSLVLTPYTS